MDNQIKIFNFEEKEVRTVEIDGETWFVAADVTKILGYTNGRKAIEDHCLKGVTKRYTLLTKGGNQELTIINESGIYQLVLTSKMPNAVKFKEWVTENVLPSIRKTGSYSVNPRLELSIEEMTLLVMQNLQEKISEQKRQLEVQRPLVEYAEAMGGADNGVDLGDFAKTYSTNTGNIIGRNRLFELLREKRVLMPGKNVPKQEFINGGYFIVKQFLVENINELKFKTLVTPAGEKWLVKKLNTFFSENK
jgi:anti-repressor protein